MVKPNIKKMVVIISTILYFHTSLAIDLANLATTLHSLTNRANELGLLDKISTFTKNPLLSDNLNQIIEALQTKEVKTDPQSAISPTIEKLLNLFINEPFTIKKNTISFKYKEVKYENTIEQFSNELLLIANVVDYISSNYDTDKTINILSNIFSKTVLYLFLNDLLIQENQNFNLIIVAGIDKKASEILQNKKATKLPDNIHYYANILELYAIVKQSKIDIYLLNPDVNIEHILNNMDKCEKKIHNTSANIRIFPDILHNRSFMDSFGAVDEGISLKVVDNFFGDLINKTKHGESLKNQIIGGFSCTQVRSPAKMLSDIIYKTNNKSKIKLYFFASGKVISSELNTSELSDPITLYGFMAKALSNLKAKSKDLNAELKNNLRLYKYQKGRNFKEVKSINDISIPAINLSDKA